MEKYTAKVEDGVLTLPDEIVKMFNLKAGDTVDFEDLGNGTILLTFPKKQDVEIDLPEDQIFMLMKIAHERDITLNQLVNEILRNAMNERK